MRHTLSMVLVCLLPAAASLAQEAPKAKAFAAYSYLRDSDTSFHGWDASLTWNLGQRFGLEGDLAGHYGSPAGSHLTQLSYLAGPHLALRGHGLTPFLHALAGGVQSRESISIAAVTISVSHTDLGALLGGGLDLPRGRRWGGRLQGGYRLVRHEGQTSGDPRLSAGITLTLGGR